jgi:Xaa-Pro aminopeptidase
VFYTDGRATRYQLAHTTIDFQRRAPKQIRAVPGRAGLALQALRALGRNGADEAAMRRLRRQLTPREVAAVRRAARYTSDWVRQLAKQL